MATEKAKRSSKYKNISVDDDVVDGLNSVADSLAEQFGFRPTISQTIRHLVKLHTDAEETK